MNKQFLVGSVIALSPVILHGMAASPYSVPGTFYMYQVYVPAGMYYPLSPNSFTPRQYQPHRYYESFKNAVIANNLRAAEQLITRYPKITWGSPIIQHVRSPKMLELILKYDAKILQYPESLNALPSWSTEFWYAISADLSCVDALKKSLTNCDAKYAGAVKTALNGLLDTMIARCEDPKSLFFIVDTFPEILASDERYERLIQHAESIGNNNLIQLAIRTQIIARNVKRVLDLLPKIGNPHEQWLGNWSIYEVVKSEMRSPHSSELQPVLDAIEAYKSR